MRRPASLLLSALVGFLGWSHCSFAQPADADAATSDEDRPPTAAFAPDAGESAAPDEAPTDATDGSNEPNDAAVSDRYLVVEDAEGGAEVEIDTTALEETAIRRIPRQAQDLSALATRRALVLRTLVRTGSPGSDWRLPTPDDGELFEMAQHLDAMLEDTATDLGLEPEKPASTEALGRTEHELIELAARRWVISPRLDDSGDRLELTVQALTPGSNVTMLRREPVSSRNLDLRAIVFTRDLVRAASPKDCAAAGNRDEGGTFAQRPNSRGRAVLALNGAAYGGYVGFTLQRAGGSSDSRLVYPLVALGAGAGLGASLLITEEWNIGVGDAWFVSAALWWPTAAGLLLADGYGVEEEGNRFAIGLLGGGIGLSLATVALSVEGVGEGGAAMTHSGGAFGMLLGGLTDLFIRGDADLSPTRGLGYGAGFGVLATGLLATQVRVAPSRVLMIDLAASLGALGGAAAASPLVFGDDRTPTEDRLWLATVAAGTLGGAAVGAYITRDGDFSASHSNGSKASAANQTRVPLPFAGVIGESVTRTGLRSPVLGGGLQGVW